MAFDLTRSYFNDMRERPVAPGAEILEEGTLLMYVDAGDGTLAVAPTAGTATDRVAGFAITDALKYATKTVVEVVTVPLLGGVVALRHNNIVTLPGPDFFDARAFNVTGAVALVAAAASPPAAGQFFIDVLAGTIEFNVAEAGDTISVTYRYTPTLAEQLATDHERSINNRAQDYFSSVAVGTESGEIFTTMYNVLEAYVVGDLVYTGADGVVTSDAASTVVVGIVSQVPGVSDGRLGVKFANLR